MLKIEAKSFRDTGHCKGIESTGNLGPIAGFKGVIRACSHYAKFCLFCQKICQREAISSANDFLHPTKFLQTERNFKDSVD